MRRITVTIEVEIDDDQIMSISSIKNYDYSAGSSSQFAEAIREHFRQNPVNYPCQVDGNEVWVLGSSAEVAAIRAAGGGSALVEVTDAEGQRVFGVSGDAAELVKAELQA